MARYYCIICLIYLYCLFERGFSENRVGDSCVDKYTNTVGRCQATQQCQSARYDFQNNGIQPTFCQFTSTNYDSPLVCCRDGVAILETIPHNHRGSLQSSNGNTHPQNIANKRISERKCEEYSQPVTENVEFLPLLPDTETLSVSASKCNYQKVELIVGGQDTELGEFPHMAAIGWPAAKGGYVFNCGGSLISERFVVTAGHCLKDPRNPEITDPNPTVVRLGEHNLNPNVQDGANPVQISIKHTHKHPDYKPPSRYNDIGLLELATSVDFEKNIRPACLWTSFNLDGQTRAIATGWGLTNTKARESSEVLQKVSLSLFKNEICEELLYQIRNRHWKGFRDSQLCAGVLGGGMDTCQGDSGGPLQIASKDNQCIYQLVGVTSFGRKCAEAGQPAVYTRISSYVDWIESVVWRDES